MMSSRVVGCRVRLASRRRVFRRRAIGAWVVIALFAFGAMRPGTADASWGAMYAQGLEQVRQAMDLVERHTRQIEDVMDRATGMMQPFSDLHAGIKELTDFRQLKRMGKMGQVYRADITNPDCYRPGNIGNCNAMSDFLPGELRRIDNDAFAILGSAANIVDGYSWSEVEAAIRATGSDRDGGSGQWLTSDAPSWVTAAVDGVDAYQRTQARVQQQKVRMFLNVRRATGLAARYQRLGTEVLRVSSAEGAGSARRYTAGGSGTEYRRLSDGGIDCGAGGFGSLLTGTFAQERGTLLAQVLELDCAGAVDGSGAALPGLEPGAHVSPNEALAVQASIGVWEAGQAATELEDLALQLAREVQGRHTIAEMAAREQLKEVKRAECPQAPGIRDCSTFTQLSVEEITRRRNALYAGGDS